jgi:hypothetical protein
MQEAELYHFWKYICRKHEPILLDGHVLRVMHPGEINLHRGPDFRAARFELDGVVYQGDVEFHLTTKDWYLHGHHKDRAFANVLLHLVGKSSSGSVEAVENKFSNSTIPTLKIPDSALQLVTKNDKKKCKKLHPANKNLLAQIHTMALERLDIKIQRILHAMQHESNSTIFYRLFFHVLGYTGNEQAYENLAHTVPIPLTNELRNEPMLMYAVYLGHAGLIPVQPEDQYSALVSSNYESFQKQFSITKNISIDWKLTGLRPGTHPHFRLAGWIKLLGLKSVSQILEGLTQAFSERFPYHVLHKRILETFSVSVTGYWKSHSRLSKHSSHLCTTFISKNRINECIVNVLIPLMAAQAIQSESDGYKHYIEGFTYSFPCPSTYHYFSAFFPWYKNLKKRIPGHILHQGLCHLYNIFCSRQKCDLCPLNGS